MQLPEQPEQPEPMLEFRGDINAWQGETQYFLVRMNDATLRKYMATWLELRGITEPTNAQTHEAFIHCRKVSYWHGVRDPDVQTARSPGYKPPEQR